MTNTRNHGSEYQRRDARARELGFRNYYDIRKRGGVHEVAKQAGPVLASLPESARRTRQAVLEALSVMRRERIPLARAARRAGVSPTAVRFWAGDAVDPKGVAAPSDRLLRHLLIISHGQTTPVSVRGNRQAALASAHLQAVSKFLETGEVRHLAPFEGKKVARHLLETDPDVLESMALSGGLQFEDIYSLVG